MKTVLLLGSIRPERQSHRLAYYLKDRLTANGAGVSFIDLKDYTIPVFGSVVSKEVQQSVDEISDCLEAAQAVIIVTPEYMGSIPAALKNVLEYCGRTLTGKVTGVAAASATKFGGLLAASNLQLALLNLGAYPAPGRLLVPEIHLAFDKENRPLYYELVARADKFLDALLTYTRILTNGTAPGAEQ